MKALQSALDAQAVRYRMYAWGGERVRSFSVLSSDFLPPAKTVASGAEVAGGKPMPGAEVPELPDSAGLSRDAIAEFLFRNEQSIRRIARQKLTRSTRSTFDSEDVMASVLRRMDTLALEGRLRPRSEGELWALVRTIAANTAVSKSRLVERARSFEAEDGAYARELVRRLDCCVSDEEAQLLVLRMASSLRKERHRELFLLRLRGANHAAAAGLLGISEGASRQVWLEVCRELRERFEGEIPSGA